MIGEFEFFPLCSFFNQIDGPKLRRFNNFRIRLYRLFRYLGCACITYRETNGWVYFVSTPVFRLSYSRRANQLFVRHSVSGWVLELLPLKPWSTDIGTVLYRHKFDFTTVD